MRNLRVAAAIAAALLATAAPAASAHEGNPDFRSVVDQVDPAIDGLEVEVVNFDDSLRMINRSGEDVIVEGYEGEPYARVLADGSVELNRNSPAYYLNDDRFGESDVPNSADPEAEPDWELVDRSSMLEWHDHRMHWMSTALPPQVRDESKETKIFDYEIPIEAGEAPGAIEGTLTWVGKDESSFPILPIVAAVLGAGAGIALLTFRRRRWAADDGGGEEDETW
jgi:hypothetical protein